MRPRRDPHALSDAERQEAVDLLGAHMVSGAISPEDLAERTELVLRARTREELHRATEGLPALSRPEVAADVKAFFAETPVPMASKALDQNLELLDVNLAIRRREAGAVGEWIRTQT